MTDLIGWGFWLVTVIVYELSNKKATMFLKNSWKREERLYEIIDIKNKTIADLFIAIEQLKQGHDHGKSKH